MNSPKISESLNRFFTVTNADSDFAANDVINMRGGEATKAGTFHKWNIFRRAGRSDDEIRANNDTRQQFLNALKESFGLEETGKALVDELANILGKDVFKPEDYTFGKDGRLNCGKPLTTRRITDVYAAVTKEIKNKRIGRVNSGLSADARELHKLVADNLCMTETCLTKAYQDSVKDEDADLGACVRKIKNSFCDLVNAHSFMSVLNQNIGISTLLRIAIEKAKLPIVSSPADRDKMADDIIKYMKDNVFDFAVYYESHESLLNEYCEINGRSRQDLDNVMIQWAERGLD